MLDVETPLRMRPGVSASDLERIMAVDLDSAFSAWRGSLEEAGLVLARIAAGEATTVKAVLLTFPTDRRRAVQMSLMWLAKLGLLEWLP